MMMGGPNLCCIILAIDFRWGSVWKERRKLGLWRLGNSRRYGKLCQWIGDDQPTQKLWFLWVDRSVCYFQMHLELP